MVKIASVQAENVKRVKAVYMEPKPEGLTVIGGRNGQGKTSVLDAIAWALGSGRMAPTNPRREGAAGDPRLRVVMDNGLVVERKGKNSALKVTDPEGRKGGQQLLDSFIDGLALNLSRFMEAPDRDKAETLLRIVGVGDREAVENILVPMLAPLLCLADGIARNRVPMVFACENIFAHRIPPSVGFSARMLTRTVCALFGCAKT